MVWRILDPRGFELEISSANLMGIIESVGILAGGVIDRNCVWGRMGAQNILIPEGSELWEKYLSDSKKTKAMSNRVTNYVVGDRIKLSNGEECVYVGRRDVVISKTANNTSHWSVLVESDLEIKKRMYVVKQDNKYVCYARLQVVEVLGHNEPINGEGTFTLAGNCPNMTVICAADGANDVKLVWRPVQTIKMSFAYGTDDKGPFPIVAKLMTKRNSEVLLWR